MDVFSYKSLFSQTETNRLTIMNFKISSRISLFLVTIFMACLIAPVSLYAREKNKSAEQEQLGIPSETLSGLKWRSIGPAMTSGRIADFAVNPDNHSEWYVAVASGNLWKT